MKLHFVQINKDGSLAEPYITLPQVAHDVRATTAEHYKKSGFSPPWVFYMAFLDSECVGTCGFKSAPKNNRVEIAYFTFPEFEKRGVATAMATLLIEQATKANVGLGLMIFVQTMPEQNASTAILQKLGFTCIGAVNHPQDGKVWEWHLSTFR